MKHTSKLLLSIFVLLSSACGTQVTDKSGRADNDSSAINSVTTNVSKVTVKIDDTFINKCINNLHLDEDAPDFGAFKCTAFSLSSNKKLIKETFSSTVAFAVMVTNNIPIDVETSEVSDQCTIFSRIEKKGSKLVGSIYFTIDRKNKALAKDCAQKAFSSNYHFPPSFRSFYYVSEVGE